MTCESCGCTKPPVRSAGWRAAFVGALTLTVIFTVLFAGQLGARQEWMEASRQEDARQRRLASEADAIGDRDTRDRLLAKVEGRKSGRIAMRASIPGATLPLALCVLLSIGAGIAFFTVRRCPQCKAKQGCVKPPPRLKSPAPFPILVKNPRSLGKKDPGPYFFQIAT